MPDSYPQVPFGQNSVNANTFAANPENRCPILLLLDTSYSMDGAPIDELNQALRQFAQDLQADSLAAKRAEVAIVTFGPVQTVCDFVSADSFYPPTLPCTGDTPLGAALLHAINMIAQRKALYKANGVMYYRPKIFLLTDGAPTDDWQEAAEAIKGGEVTKDFSFYPIAVQGADMAVLQAISTITPLRLKGLQFREMFAWLSSSISAVSRSMPGDEVELQNPASPDGWATF